MTKVQLIKLYNGKEDHEGCIRRHYNILWYKRNDKNDKYH